MRKLLITFVILTSLILAGCDDDNGSSFDSPFVGGTKALELEFVEESPPSEIYDNKESAFAILVNVRNVGETDLEPGDGFVFIEGISANEFGVSNADLEQDLPELLGADKNAEGTVQEGEFDIVYFDELMYQQDITGNIANTVIRAIACYEYETLSTATICLKDEAIDISSRNDVCNIAGSKSVANSGGPIQITEVRESSTGKEGIQLAFTITNNGEANDRFFKPETDCDMDPSNLDKNVVYFEVGAIDNEQINGRCTGFKGGAGGNSGLVSIPGGKSRTITCSFDTSSVSSDFETRVNAKVGYKYRQFIETPVVIKDISGR